MISDFEFRISDFPPPTRREGGGGNSEFRIPNSELKKPFRLVAAIALLLLIGCGKEGQPLPPEIRVAERTTDLTAYQEDDDAVLRWSYPAMTTAGQNLTDIEEIQVWRAALPLGQEPPPPISPQDPRSVARDDGGTKFVCSLVWRPNGVLPASRIRTLECCASRTTSTARATHRRQSEGRERRYRCAVDSNR
jgi:hypothetical protein